MTEQYYHWVYKETTDAGVLAIIPDLLNKGDKVSAQGEMAFILSEIAFGGMCGLICDFCPLRRWKSRGITKMFCLDILTKIRKKFTEAHVRTTK